MSAIQETAGVKTDGELIKGNSMNVGGLAYRG